MNPERQQFLNLRSKPGRLTSEEAGWLLGFMPHELPMLTSAGLLPPLGRPPPNGCKFFASHQLEKLRQDPAWLAKASDAIVQYWRDNNRNRVTASAPKRDLKRKIAPAPSLRGQKSLFPVRSTNPKL